ncbi:MAG: SDR family NAD(P)-dependent oxidoreductase [Balneolaceae bacterium]
MRLKPNSFLRSVFFFAGDTVALVISAIFAFAFVSSFANTPIPFPFLITVLLIGSMLLGLTLYKMHKANWRFVSLREMVRIVLGLTAGYLFFLVTANIFMDVGRFEHAFAVLMLTNGLLFVGGFRISKRVVSELVSYPITIKNRKNTKKSVIIFGAGSAGDQIIRDIFKNDDWNLTIQGVFDDNNNVHGTTIHGIKIMGTRKHLFNYLRYNQVDQLIIAVPSMPKKDLKKIIDEVKLIRPDLSIKVLPSFHSLTDDPVGIRNVRDISIEDILGRESVKIDMNSIKESVSGKTVLVTGAGGSIGSEIVRQCANLAPKKLIALDVDETELFNLNNELKDNGIIITPCVANIADKKKIDQLFGQLKPDLIFHAAAYKHVPMMESFPEEAIKVNIGGTRILATLACKHNVDKFVMISTDKAVNPTNVMGATKRVAEEVCMSLNGSCITKFISVRFGNVLGSRGSVVPIFMEQIKKGGPVTITDPEMKRFFMTIPEAVLLVMQAGSMGDGGEVFVLDMGEPVKIMDMASDLIRLHGLEPGVDIQFEFTGLRPGEKLFEELLNAEEGVTETKHAEIYKAICSKRLEKNELSKKLAKLFNSIDSSDFDCIRTILHEMVPSYTFNKNLESENLLQKSQNGHTKKTREGLSYESVG